MSVFNYKDYGKEYLEWALILDDEDLEKIISVLQGKHSKLIELLKQNSDNYTAQKISYEKHVNEFNNYWQKAIVIGKMLSDLREIQKDRILDGELHE